MSTYGGRRGPNVSQYLRHLNTIPTETTNEDSFIDDDLSLFTNTRFFDFESGQTTDFQAPAAKPESEQISPSTESGTTTSPVTDLGGLDFIADFSFPDFAQYQAPALNPSFTDALPIQPLQNAPQIFPTSVTQQPQQQQPGTFSSSQSNHVGDKRKSESLDTPTQINFEDASRLAAEEDKRRRNTAASARFRIKKKQREQALERTAKDMSEKVTALEGRIQQLETENKWLKNMILEKNGGNEQISTLLDKELGSRDKPDAKSAEALKPEN